MFVVFLCDFVFLCRCLVNNCIDVVILWCVSGMSSSFSTFVVAVIFGIIFTRMFGLCLCRNLNFFLLCLNISGFLFFNCRIVVLVFVNVVSSSCIFFCVRVWYFVRFFTYIICVFVCVRFRILFDIN